ncbi:GGDEF domain-containing protein [Treponema sp. C6A8]|uniref:GGDEF domain-containing protein n=1 Tax=Treponema sp. C6A8 TaxID=1410609 RepID=UPI000571EF83|nr:GGDEF domain-containing protein [Treponema sp. C6A8]
MLFIFYSFFHIKDNTFKKITDVNDTQYLEWKITSAEYDNQTLVLPYSSKDSLGDFKITARLPELNSTSMLLIRCRYETLTAKIDGDFIYASDVATVAGIKTTIGKTRCHIPLSKEFSNKEIEISIQLQQSKIAKSSLSEIVLSSRSSYMIQYLKENILLFVTSLLLIICSFGSFVFFLLSYFGNKQRITSLSQSLFYLAGISILTSIWSICDSHILSLFTDNLLLDGVLVFAALLLMAVAFAGYLTSLYGENIVIKIISILSQLNIVIQTLIFILGIKDLNELIIFTHLIFGTEILYTIIMSIVNLHKFETSEKLFLNIGNILFASFTLVVIILYNYNRDGNYFLFAVVAFFIYCLMQIEVSVVRFVKMIKKQAALREAEKYAFTDQLTKMDNRRAYSVFKKHIGNTTLTDDFHVVYFDLNGLKTINDKFGHSAGDEYIIGVTDILKKVFYDAMLRCRMGGDEFLVVLKSSRDVLKKRLFYFDSLIENWHNDKIKTIAVSYGYSSACDYDNPTFEGLVSKADEFMYKMKNDYYEKSGTKRRTDS